MSVRDHGLGPHTEPPHTPICPLSPALRPAHGQPSVSHTCPALGSSCPAGPPGPVLPTQLGSVLSGHRPGSSHHFHSPPPRKPRTGAHGVLLGPAGRDALGFHSRNHSPGPRSGQGARGSPGPPPSAGGTLHPTGLSAPHRQPLPQLLSHPESGPEGAGRRPPRRSGHQGGAELDSATHPHLHTHPQTLPRLYFFTAGLWLGLQGPGTPGWAVFP